MATPSLAMMAFARSPSAAVANDRPATSRNAPAPITTILLPSRLTPHTSRKVYHTPRLTSFRPAHIVTPLLMHVRSEPLTPYPLARFPSQSVRRAGRLCAIAMLAAGLLLAGGAPLDAKPKPQPAPSKAEDEVKAQIDKARGLAEEGKADAAVDILQRVIATSPQRDRKSTRLNSSH